MSCKTRGAFPTLHTLQIGSSITIRGIESLCKALRYPGALPELQTLTYHAPPTPHRDEFNSLLKEALRVHREERERTRLLSRGRALEDRVSLQPPPPPSGAMTRSRAQQEKENEKLYRTLGFATALPDTLYAELQEMMGTSRFGSDMGPYPDMRRPPPAPPGNGDGGGGANGGRRRKKSRKARHTTSRVKVMPR